jgi:hypothetical protein
MDQWLTLLLRIREVLYSYLGPQTGYLTEDFRGFQSLQESVGIVP